MAERQQRYLDELHVLHGERETDDREREERGEQQVHDREFEARQDDPDDVQEQRQGAAWRFRLEDVATKRGENTARQLEALEAERDADNREAQDDAAEDVTQEDQESPEDEEDEVAEQANWRDSSGSRRPPSRCNHPA